MTDEARAELTDVVAGAARAVFSMLQGRTVERFYYCALVTTEEATAPQLAAWSHEALDREAGRGRGAAERREMLRWSYADSPYLDFGRAFFEPVRAAWAARPAMADTTDEEWDQEVDLRLGAITDALARLSDEGVFGTGDERAEMMVLAEVAPPDRDATERAVRLNPAGPALTRWREEMAEPA